MHTCTVIQVPALDRVNSYLRLCSQGIIQSLSDQSFTEGFGSFRFFYIYLWYPLCCQHRRIVCNRARDVKKCCMAGPDVKNVRGSSDKLPAETAAARKALATRSPRSRRGLAPSQLPAPKTSSSAAVKVSSRPTMKSTWHNWPKSVS